VFAAALVEGIIPNRIDTDSAVTRALADRLIGSGAPDSHDARLVSCLVASAAIGWGVAGGWLKDSAGLAEMDDAQLAEEMATALQRLVGQYR
jgi:hypothetical protein